MITAISIVSLLVCVCVIWCYTTYMDAHLANIQAESYLRMANERLYAASKILENERKQQYRGHATNRITVHEAGKSIGKGAKILKFERPLKSVPNTDDAA